MKKVTFLMLLGGIFLATSQAEVLTSLVGDMDNFGTNAPLDTPIRLQDCQWESEDGDMDTDFTRWFNQDYLFNWSHTFTLPADIIITGATLTMSTFDMEDKKSDYEDRLFLDNVEVPGAFDNVDTPKTAYIYPNVCTFELPSNFFGLLNDGQLNVFLNSKAGLRADYIAIDYSMLEITYIPEPATIILTGLGFLTVVRGRKR